MAGLTMTQEPQNPEEPQPPVTPPSAWAPRSAWAPPDEETPASDSPASESPAAEPPVSESSEPAASEEAPKSPRLSRPPNRLPRSLVRVPPVEPPVRKRRGVPIWLLPIFAIVPAVIVGIAVYFLANGGSNDSPNAAAGIVDGLMRLGQQNQENISSYDGVLPPDFSTRLPDLRPC